MCEPSVKLGSHISCSRESEKVWEEWTPTLPSELSFWELKSRWTPKFSKNDSKDQNSLIEEFLISLKKLLERRCLKWVRMTHLDTSNTSYGQKKGRESNCQFDFWPLKVRNRPNLLTFRWHVRYRWKALNEGYNFASDLISIGGLHTKLWAPKVVEVLTFGISGLPLWSPGTKWHLSVGPMAKHIVYYKGEGGGFPKSRLWWFLWVCVCPWFVHATKCPTMH
jgi:hypothetical protein